MISAAHIIIVTGEIKQQNTICMTIWYMFWYSQRERDEAKHTHYVIYMGFKGFGGVFLYYFLWKVNVDYRDKIKNFNWLSSWPQGSFYMEGGGDYQNNKLTNSFTVSLMRMPATIVVLWARIMNHSQIIIGTRMLRRPERHKYVLL